MIVEAVRDDGAILVTQGDRAAVILDDRVYHTTRASALSKGVPWVAARDQEVSAQLRERLAREFEVPL